MQTEPHQRRKTTAALLSLEAKQPWKQDSQLRVIASARSWTGSCVAICAWTTTALSSIQKTASSPPIPYAAELLCISSTLYATDCITKEHVKPALFSRLQHPIFSEISEDIAPSFFVERNHVSGKRHFFLPSKGFHWFYLGFKKQKGQTHYSSPVHLPSLFHEHLLGGQTRKIPFLLLSLSEKKKGSL